MQAVPALDFDVSPRGATLSWAFLGRRAYAPTWTLQEAKRRAILDENAPDTLICVEHDPVVTLGRRAAPEQMRWSAEELERRGVDVVTTNRGGGATAHGPGQLVIYPVVRLQGGIVEHLAGVAGAIVSVVAALGVSARWTCAPAGVWVGDAKLAACGIHVQRGVAIHGFALNVTHASLEHFLPIVPCGLNDARVTCLADFVTPPPLAPLAALIARAVAEARGQTHTEDAELVAQERWGMM